MDPQILKNICNRLFGVVRNRQNRIVEIGWPGAFFDLRNVQGIEAQSLLDTFQNFQNEINSIGVDLQAAQRANELERARCADLNQTIAEKYDLLHKAHDLLVKAASDLTDANHKATNYKHQRDYALRDNARLRELLAKMGQQITAAAAFAEIIESQAQDLPAGHAFEIEQADLATQQQHGIAIGVREAAQAMRDRTPKPQSPAQAVDEVISEQAASRAGGQ